MITLFFETLNHKLKLNKRIFNYLMPVILFCKYYALKCCQFESARTITVISTKSETGEMNSRSIRVCCVHFHTDAFTSYGLHSRRD